MLEFPSIIDLTGYTAKMRLSFLEKTFFLDKIPATVFLDYGCADGSMIEFMFKMFPEYHYFGYDEDPKMIELANKKNIPNATFGTNMNDLFNKLKNQKEKEKTAIICSSVIHEIYSYKKFNDTETFWQWCKSFDYACIRDMMVETGKDKESVSLDNVWKIANHYLNEEDDSYILKDFQKKWGPITTTKTLLHFLLKYRYKNNWERECAENYFWLDHEEFLAQLRLQRWNVVYENHYTLPFLKSRVKADFDIDITDKTHIQIILER
jgi:SAM-dependent methyltransferase